VPAGLRQHRQASSCAKRWTTSARGSTAHARRSRPLRSGCRRRARPASICLRRRRARRRSALAAQRSAPCARVRAAGRRHLRLVRAQRCGLSSERVMRLLRRNRWRDRHAAVRASVLRRLVVRRPGRLYERRGPRFVVLPPSAPRPRAGAGRWPDERTPRSAHVQVRHRTCYGCSRAGTQGLVPRSDRLLHGIHPARDSSVARVRSGRALASRRLDTVRIASSEGDRRRREPCAVRSARGVYRAPCTAVCAGSHGSGRICLLAVW